MLFYLCNNIPQGMLNIEKVEDLIKERFQTYCSSKNLQNDTEEFDLRDGIAHFFMSIIAVDFFSFKKTYINGEIKIFKKKLETQNCTNVKKELHAAHKFLKSLSQTDNCKKLRTIESNRLLLVIKVLQTLISKKNHVFKKTHSKNCKKFKMNLPFTFLLKPIAKREIEVKNGRGFISCGEWNKVVEIIFEFLLEIEMSLLKNNKELKKLIFELEDDRIRQIIRRFKNFFDGSLQKEVRSIKAEQLDEESQYFPPCMANLHQILRRTHRLSYESRYQYILFLKDIGVSVNENISLWESEYSKPHEGSTCTHEWEEKQKRYKYQIQHLYGLVGSHYLKSSHSCEKFTGVLHSKMDGGCPFQHLSSENLAKALPAKLMELPDIEDVFKYKNAGLPHKACAAYLNCQKKSLFSREFNESNWNNSKVTYIVSPLHYYNTAYRIKMDMEYN